MSLFVQNNGAIFVEKGTPLPFACPKCEAVIPITTTEQLKQTSQTCWSCSYTGLTSEFDCEWDFIPIKVQ